MGWWNPRRRAVIAQLEEMGPDIECSGSQHADIGGAVTAEIVNSSWLRCRCCECDGGLFLASTTARYGLLPRTVPRTKESIRRRYADPSERGRKDRSPQNGGAWGR
jgi:hypothetical protein